MPASVQPHRAGETTDSTERHTRSYVSSQHVKAAPIFPFPAYWGTGGAWSRNGTSNWAQGLPTHGPPAHGPPKGIPAFLPRPAGRSRHLAL